MKNQMKCCELCNQQASSYCPSDSAFLCFNCDDVVHGANFLVARHHRHLLCSKCNCFTGVHISGAITVHRPSTCRSCSPECISNDATDCLPSLSSESCATALKKRKAGHSLSSVTDEASPATAAAKKKIKRSFGTVEVAEKVFVRWSRELELEVTDNHHVALKALSVCLRKWKLLPFRVAAAASFWLGIRLCGDGCIATSQNLLRLEAISRVPTKLILAAHDKLTRVFTHSLQLEEAWDES